MDFRKRIIVALDVSTRDQALSLVKVLRGRVGLFKVGSQLFTSEGPSLVREIIQMGEAVFLDLKFHDIPNTVAQAGLAASRLGVSMITAHTSGGLKMLSNLVDTLKSSEPEGRCLIFGVTLLTSLDEQDLEELGYGPRLEEQVLRLARIAQRAGLDGLVASVAELSLLRKHLGSSLKVITPGVRPAGTLSHDQARIATPLAALNAGADYLVIGRPVIAAGDPLASLEAIVSGLSEGPNA